jgi:hypothetical protein
MEVFSLLPQTFNHSIEILVSNNALRPFNANLTEVRNIELWEYLEGRCKFKICANIHIDHF